MLIKKFAKNAVQRKELLELSVREYAYQKSTFKGSTSFTMSGIKLDKALRQFFKDKQSNSKAKWSIKGTGQILILKEAGQPIVVGDWGFKPSAIYRDEERVYTPSSF